MNLRSTILLFAALASGHAGAEGLRDLKGSYQLETGEVMYVALENGKCVLQFAGKRTELFPVTPERLVSQDSAFELDFKRDPDGSVRVISLRYPRT
ncbi:MAG: hypothetical protein ACXU8N_03485 [Telluria sp.]